MSRSLSRLQAVILGLAVLTGVALTAVAVVAVGTQQWPLGDSFILSAGFQNIRGVEEGTRVRVQGMDAGEVVQVQLPEKPGADVMLKMRLNGRFRRLLCADATAQIVNDNMMGGKVVEIDPGKAAETIAENAVIASRPTTELTDLLGQGTNVLQGVRDGEGTIGKLLKNDEAYTELVETLRQGRKTLTSIKQDADAIKSMPLVRNYVTDAQKELYRPDCERNRQWFHANELFEDRRAVLSAQGRQKLNGLVPWLEGLKHKGSEVVVAAYADPRLDAETAQALTQKQSTVVCDYLTSQHGVQKMGWLSWLRKVTPIGCGIDAPPDGATEQLPLPRVEVLVFVPQK